MDKKTDKMVFNDRIKEAKEQINQYLEWTSDKRLSLQLSSVLQELEEMSQVRNRTIFIPYYLKGLADDIDFPEDIAQLLLAVWEDYKQLTGK